MSKIRRELSEKLSEISRLQLELNRREDSDDISENLERVVATLERENNKLKVYNYVYCKVAEIGDFSKLLFSICPAFWTRLNLFQSYINVQVEKSELQALLEKCRKPLNDKIFPDASESLNQHPSGLKGVSLLVCVFYTFTCYAC